MKKILILAAALAVTETLSASASIIVNIGEQWNSSTLQTDLNFSFSGSVNTSQLTPSGTYGGALANVQLGYDLVYFDCNVPSNDYYPISSYPAGKISTDTTQYYTYSTATGDHFGFSDTFMVLPSSYVSSTAISGSMTLAGKTLADVSANPGNYVWTLSNGETITTQVIPEPATMAFIGVFGIGALAVRRIFMM